MDYFINLLRPNKRSNFRIYAGIVSLAIGAVFGIACYRNQQETYQWAIVGCYLFSGIFYLLNGLGVGVKIRAFIHITDNGICSKLGRRELEEKASWNEIKSIKYQSNKFVVERKDDTNFEIRSELGLTFQKIQELKNIFRKMADKHHISIIET